MRSMNALKEVARIQPEVQKSWTGWNLKRLQDFLRLPFASDRNLPRQ